MISCRVTIYNYYSKEQITQRINEKSTLTSSHRCWFQYQLNLNKECWKLWSWTWDAISTVLSSWGFTQKRTIFAFGVGDQYWMNTGVRFDHGWPWFFYWLLELVYHLPLEWCLLLSLCKSCSLPCFVVPLRRIRLNYVAPCPVDLALSSPPTPPSWVCLRWPYFL